MAYGTVNADVIGTSVSGSNLGAGNASIMKNRIINGAMVIDQRNAGASISATDGSFSVDRWRNWQNSGSGSKGNAGQNLNSASLPIGFNNYLGFQTTSAYSVSGTDAYAFQHRPEGFNLVDLNWGSANAKTVTLSFWVQSSLTGTFGGSIRDTAGTASYPFSYTISSANTWTQIAITITGATTGTWGTTNNLWGYISFSLGTASGVSASAGSWAAGSYWSATGATSVVGTNGATFYITGVQLEVGSSATGYEYRQYGQELALCQRYCPAYTMSGGGTLGVAVCYASSFALLQMWLPVPARVPPTGVTVTGSVNNAYTNGTPYALTSIGFDTGGSNNVVGLQLNGTSLPTTGSLNPRGSNITIIYTGCEL